MTAAPDISHEIRPTDRTERALLATLLARPDLLAAVETDLGPDDFAEPGHADVYRAMAAIHSAGRPVDLPVLLAELGDDGVGAHDAGAALADLVDDASDPLLVARDETALRDLVRRVRHASLTREIARCADVLRTEPGHAGAVQWMATLLQRRHLLDGAEPGAEVPPFTGEKLLGLLARPRPDPVYAGIPPRGHFSLLVAPPFTGKSSLVSWIAMAVAGGVAPWEGAPVLGPGRCLLLSPDESAEQVVRRMHALATFHPAGPLARYAHRLDVIGPDPEIEPEALDALRFTDSGLDRLDQRLRDAGAAGEPYHFVVVDAYADMLPAGASENSNEDATRIGGRLEAIAVRHGPAIQALHHARRPDDRESSADLRFAGRGATALAAKARAVFALDLVPGCSHLRTIRTATNLSAPPKDMLVEVCSPEAPDAGILYYRPGSAESDVRPEDVLQPGETLTTNELARRLAGASLAEDRDPPGELKRRAAALRERWREAGLVTVTPGPNNSKVVELVQRAGGPGWAETTSPLHAAVGWAGGPPYGGPPTGPTERLRPPLAEPETPAHREDAQ